MIRNYNSFGGCSKYPANADICTELASRKAERQLPGGDVARLVLLERYVGNPAPQHRQPDTGQHLGEKRHVKGGAAATEPQPATLRHTQGLAAKTRRKR